MILRTWMLMALVACGGPGDVGMYCDDDRDCMFGECIDEGPDGYCSAECDDEGSFSQCPVDTVCKRMGGDRHRCLLLCESDRHCPPGSECRGVDHSGGARACVPD